MTPRRQGRDSDSTTIDGRRFTATLMPDDDWWHALWPNPLAVLRGLGIEPGMDVVDLCCGSGHFTGPLCPWVWPGTVWALELDRELLDKTRQRCAGYDNCRALVADARELAHHIPHPVDLVFIANTLHGVEDKQGLAREIHGVLKPGGHLAVINWYPLPREHTTVLGKARGPDTTLRMHPQQLTQVVEAAGFAGERVEKVGPYHYAALFVRDEG